MPPAVLLDLLRAKPFVPFRIHLSDGTVYRIPHPDLVAVAIASATVSFPDTGGDLLTEIVAMRHVVRLEPIPAKKEPTA
jgi:hypothetical protein